VAFQSSAFVPVIGACYEVHFGKIKLGDEEGYWSARIKVNGIHCSQWEDLDTGKSLDHRLCAYVVQVHQKIKCP